MLIVYDEFIVQGGSKFMDGEIVVQCVVFLLGGYEILMIIFFIVFYFLVLNEDIQEKLRNEIC